MRCHRNLEMGIEGGCYKRVESPLRLRERDGDIFLLDLNGVNLEWEWQSGPQGKMDIVGGLEKRITLARDASILSWLGWVLWR